MIRYACASICIATLAAPAFADVTIKQSVSGKAMGTGGVSTSTTFIKGSKMRVETVVGDSTRVSIFDLDAQKMYSFDLKKKEAEVMSLVELQADMAKAVDVSAMKATFEPNGKTKQIAGKTATGYDMAMSMPMSMGGSKDMNMTMNMSGPVWIVKGAPGSADWVNFYKMAADKGFIFGDPLAAKANPGQARALTEMYRKMAETGGIAYETEMTVKVDGGGPLGGLMAKMGGGSTTSTVTEISAGALAADLFAPPADYKLKERK
ncbi:MAG: hypothetical protein FJW27_04000 [Acidimicrobiia bacterium]|nr:hypothetical protein [Acidimicrobiia bacterium]